MIDVDVRKIAQSLVENHGQRLAWQHAAAKALESASDGEVGIVWLRIIDAIDDLQRTERRPGERVN